MTLSGVESPGTDRPPPDTVDQMPDSHRPPPDTVDQMPDSHRPPPETADQGPGAVRRPTAGAGRAANVIGRVRDVVGGEAGGSVRAGVGVGRSVDEVEARLGRAKFSVKEARGFIGMEARMVPVEELRPNRHQPRGPIDDEGCRELARSIALTGVIQPIVARQTFDGLEIVAGERRWRSSRLAGLKTVPVLIREATDEEMIELALVENIHREDLNAVDRARAYKQYCDVFELKAEEVAARLGEDRTTVTNYIRLLDLPETVLSMLSEGRISMGHARSLLGAKSSMQQVELAEAVAAGGMSVRSLEELIRRGRRPRRQEVPKESEFTSSGLPSHLKAIERKFEEVLSTKVWIELAESKSDGRVVIEFFGLNDFEQICRKIGVLKKDDASK